MDREVVEMENLDLVIDSKNRLQRADSVHVVCIAWHGFIQEEEKVTPQSDFLS